MPDFIQAHTEADFATAHSLFMEYAQWLGIDLCFQGFDSELLSLPQMYGAPNGGLILVKDEDRFLGCVGVRKFSDSSCELKRMWIQPAYQNQGLGEKLLIKAMELGKHLGYTTMKLDTLQTMTGPIYLYKKHGFQEIPAYYKNPNAVVYFEKVL